MEESTMNQEAIVLTKEGYAKLETELDGLKTVKRKEVAEKIKEARGFGDLSENAEYDEARKEQAEVEARITKIEHILRNAEVVDESEIDMEHVSVGSVVKVFDQEFEEEMEYHLVGATEADPFEGKISMESPIGKALIGKEVGEKVLIEVPDGMINLKVLAISR